MSPHDPFSSFSPFPGMGTPVPNPGAALADDLTNRVEQVVLDAEKANAPLELDPQRSRLFELFVMADAAGFVDDQAEHDLSAEGLAKSLAGRWGLAKALHGGSIQPSALPPGMFRRFQLLWSMMRMWMEWGYAWKRWSEFHQHDAVPNSPDDD
jgi:hypothetical protein